MLSFHSMTLSIIDWKIRKWKITWYNSSLFAVSFISLYLYLIFVIIMPDYFTYSGASAVFLGLAYIPIWYIHYRIDNFRNKVDFDSYVDMMKSKIINKPTTSQILDDSIIESDNSYLLFWKSRCLTNTHILYVANIFILVWYGFTIHQRAVDHKKVLGFINMGVIIISDLILIFWELLQSTTGSYLSPFKINLIIMITRGMFWF